MFSVDRSLGTGDRRQAPQRERGETPRVDPTDPNPNPNPNPNPEASVLAALDEDDGQEEETQWTFNPLNTPWRNTPRPRVPRKAPVERMRALRQRIQDVTLPAVSHPLDDSGEEGGGTSKTGPASEPPPFKLRPEVFPSTSRPAACPALAERASLSAESTTSAARKRTGKPRSRTPKTVRDRLQHEAEVTRLGDEPPGLRAESLADRTRAWREMTHPEHMAAAALVKENEKWRNAWVPEGWRRYRRRWYRWHGKVTPDLTITEGAVQLSLETECGTIPGSGGDVGIPDAWCSLYRVHQWNQREREAAEEAAHLALPSTASGDSLSLDSAEPSDANPATTLDLTLSPSSSQPATSGDISDLEDSQRSLNFTQQLMERQLAAARSENNPSVLTTVTEGVEPTPLKTIQEETHLELLLTIQKQQRHRLRPILEGNEAVAAPANVTNAQAAPREEEPPSFTQKSEPEDSAGEEEEEKMSIQPLRSYPLESRTQSRARRRAQGQERRAKERQLQADRDLEGGWYFGPDPRSQPAPPRTRPIRSKQRVPLHHPVRAAICAHLRRDGQVMWNQDSQLTAIRDKEGTLLLVFWALLKGQRVRVLVDSGASDEFISSECVKRLNLTVRANGMPLNVTLADGSVQTSAQVAYGKLTAETSEGTYSEVIKMRVLPLGIKVDIVLGGRDFDVISGGHQREFGGPFNLPEWRKKFQKLIESFSPRVIREALPNFDALRKDEVAHVRLQEGWNGIAPAKRPYKMSMVELTQLRERLDELLSKGYIRPSSSPFAAPVLMVPKPGKPEVLRMVCDFRAINSLTVKDKYPLPDIQQLFDSMHGAKYFSSFDAVDGFWQMAMASEDVEKTAFTSPYGSYEWLVMPMGLTNSPSCYQRRMQRALGHLPFVRIFLDDCILFSNTLEEHLSHLQQFLEVCENQGIYLKESKCQLLQTQIRFLGHVISREGSQPQHDKLAAIRDWPALENATHRWAFEEIKKALCSSPTLALPDMKAAAEGRHPFVVQTDASGVALGGVLMQDVGNGLQPIAFESRQFNGAEQNYHAGERELCALHHCTTQTWRHYLIWTEFQLQGDHKPLVWLMAPGQPLSRRQARWYMDLVEVGVPEMEYIPGALLWVPDALSRRPDYKEISAREGLVEAGFVHPVTGKPQRPPSAADTASKFRPAAGKESRQGRAPLGVVDPNKLKERKSNSAKTKEPEPVLAYSGTLTWMDSPQLWMDALHTLQLAETGYEKATLAVQTRSGKLTASSPPSPRKTPVDFSATPKCSEASTRLLEPSDRQDWKFRADMFDFLSQEYGPFEVDACCDLGGKNRQVNRYWTDCLKENWRGLNVWCNPPFSSNHLTIEAVLRKYVEEWRLDPENTSALFVLPDFQSRMPQWRQLFRSAGMRVEYIIPTHDAQGEPVQMFAAPDGALLDLPWPLLVVYAPPARQRVKRERKTSSPPPIVRTGEAASVRDLHQQISGGQFLKALQAEYGRPGPLQTLRKEIQEAPHQRTRDFCVVGDVLWRVSAGRYQLVLGEDSPLREVVLQEAHASVSAGHAGRDKTLERVLRRFWWKGAAEDVGRWVSSCTICQAVRPRNSYPDGLLNPHTIPTRLWQVVSVDFVTGLPVTARNHDAFATFTCKLSKMVHIIPLNFQDSSSEVIARIYFDHIWKLHGTPMKIVSDRDPRFQDAMWKELMRLMGTKVASTTPYNPRSDGQAEHTNRVVEDMLRSFVGSNPEDWDLWCANVEFAINDTRSDVTGFTPFELVLGHSPMSQLDLFLQAAAGQHSKRKGGEGTAHEMASKFAAQLEDARTKLELAQQRQRHQFDQRHTAKSFQLGDLVWVDAKHLTENIMNRESFRKLGPRWHGPLPITERFFSDQQRELPEIDRGAPVAYRLKLPPKWRIHDVFAQHRLKEYRTADEAFALRRQIPTPAKVLVDGQSQTHVSKILARRVKPMKGGKEVEEFLVRWTGYSNAHDSWKTRESLNYGGELEQLTEFEQLRLSREGQAREKALQEVRMQRKQRRERVGALTFLDTSDEGKLTSLDNCLPWEQYCRSADAFVTHLALLGSGVSTRELRLLVLFSGTGSVERSFMSCYPKSTVVTVDHDPRWQPTYAEKVQDWDFKRYAPGYFDVIWASPPCTEYSQAKTTGGTPEPLTSYYGERKPGLDYSWQHIIVHPSGALRRWERNRGGGWFLEDATQLKAPVAPFSLPISRVGIAYWNPTIVIDDDEYHGIPYKGRKPTHSASTNSEDSGTGAVSWSKEKLPDSDDNDDAGVTNSKEKLPDSDDKDDAGVIYDMDTASPKWEPTSPEYDDTEDDVSEFDDLVADDAEEQAEARRLKRLGLQLIMDEKGELHWVPKGTSPTSPVQPDDQPITEQKSEAISEDAPASVVETVHAPPKKPYGSDTGLTSMGENKAGVSEETKRQPRKYPRCWTHEYITQLKRYSIRSDSDEEEGLDVAPRRKKAKISKGQ
ncbi:hypothetical protein CYMTET_48393 [Cymbomonas tetramitiformis]|uniref:RNA-directed DNA polymerase n=1 Tax=Cymbomonas tetramitiformis TaxID=36881 RepID=A0AAE0EVM4_9CHLO|nr:hypothetical protein CYMTET_48393 [Cymbomonas tetramitiformis]